MFFTLLRQSFLFSVTDPSRGGAAGDLSETSLRAAGAEQMRIIVQADAETQQAFMYPNYMLNGPSNRVLRKEVLVDMLAQGKMGTRPVR